MNEAWQKVILCKRKSWYHLGRIHSCELKTCVLDAGERPLRDSSPFFSPFISLKVTNSEIFSNLSSLGYFVSQVGHKLLFMITFT